MKFKDFLILLLLWVLLISSTFKGQLDFEAIWSRGYVDGYCYEQDICIEPVVPVAPVARYRDTTYNIIYNRGFIKGLKDYKNE